MPTVTIIADDKAVYVDGAAIAGIDLSTLDPNIYAIQWDGAKGHIEYRTITCAHCGVDSRKPNDTITDFSPYQAFVDAYGSEKTALEEQAAAQREAPVSASGAVNVIAN